MPGFKNQKCYGRNQAIPEKEAVLPFLLNNNDFEKK